MAWAEVQTLVGFAGFAPVKQNTNTTRSQKQKLLRTATKNECLDSRHSAYDRLPTPRHTVLLKHILLCSTFMHALKEQWRVHKTEFKA